MKVEIVSIGDEDDAIRVSLDTGIELGLYATVMDPESERFALEQMIKSCIAEARLNDIDLNG